MRRQNIQARCLRDKENDHKKGVKRVIYRASSSGVAGVGTQGHALKNSLFLVALATELMKRGLSLKPQRELFVPSFGL